MVAVGLIPCSSSTVEIAGRVVRRGDPSLQLRRARQPIYPEQWPAEDRLHLEFDEVTDAITWLKRQNFTVYLVDTSESDNYRHLDYAGRTAIVVGSERCGISKPWYQHSFTRISVPMLGRADSLNVSVSASVLLYEARAWKNDW